VNVVPENLQSILTKNEEIIRDLYGEKISQRGRRFIKFIDNTSASVLIKTTLFPPVVGLTVGGTVGGLIGRIGGPKGAAFGASSGVGVGILAGTTYSSHNARKKYKTWLKQIRNDEVFIELTEIFKKYPALKEFTCPLTGEIMHSPYTDPWGHVYEKEAIEKWVKKEGNSPVTGLPLKPSDLRPDYLTMGKIAKCYQNILEQEASSSHLSKIQWQCISCLLNDLSEQKTFCFYAENKLLLKELKAGKISRKVYASQLSILASILD
jgi:hypothetical protein